VKNTITDLRNHLFETIEALKDDEKPMDIERAKAVCNVARTLIDSAKVEVKYLEVTGQDAAGDFLGDQTVNRERRLLKQASDCRTGLEKLQERRPA
jgi:hypothetical protein